MNGYLRKEQYDDDMGKVIGQTPNSRSTSSITQ